MSADLKTRALNVDGGATAGVRLMAFRADVCVVPLVAADGEDASSRGAGTVGMLTMNPDRVIGDAPRRRGKMAGT